MGERDGEEAKAVDLAITNRSTVEGSVSSPSDA
jgi:hypothetical protein